MLAATGLWQQVLHVGCQGGLLRTLLWSLLGLLGFQLAGLLVQPHQKLRRSGELPAMHAQSGFHHYVMEERELVLQHALVGGIDHCW